MCSKIKRIKEFKTTFEFECVRKSKEWKNSKRATCSVIIVLKWSSESWKVINYDGESDEDNYSEENEGVESDDDKINVVHL